MFKRVQKLKGNSNLDNLNGSSSNVQVIMIKEALVFVSSPKLVAEGWVLNTTRGSRAVGSSQRARDR